MVILRFIIYIFVFFTLPHMALAEGDSAKGEKVFKRCAACHMVGEKARNKTGPQLNGLIGRLIGSVEDYRYSDELLTKKEAGEIWNEDTLQAYILNPKDFIGARSKMPAQRLKEKQLVDLLAYLKTIPAQE